MGRCFSCCQENCGFHKSCSCSCHREDEQSVAVTLPRELAPLATFYAVRNAKGEFYRTYAQGGRGSGWVKELTDARLWTTIGPAKSKITTLSNQNPKDVVPELIEFIVREIKVVNQNARVAEAKVKKQIEIENRKKAHAERELQQAQKALVEAQAKINRLTKG